MFRTATVLVLLCVVSLPGRAFSDNRIAIESPMSPPAWALLERQLLRANSAACEEFFAKYFDERGFLLCVERWGGDDGPDDAIENCNDWPILHALGGGDRVLQMYKHAWEGHLRQFTLAKTRDVPFARDGMYYKEFPVMFDWLHNGEGLTVFNLQGLSDPNDRNFQQRVRRYAGFYMNEDPQAPNYDAQHKIIRSLFNGSRGPLLRNATALDWAGDPIEVEYRFRLGHGERTYEEMLEHFKDYQDIVGDHPSNLLTTCLAINAYMLSHEVKYKSWLLEYVDAWRQRMLDNGGIIPTKIGLDGKTGGETGKWYAGVYGWGFSMVMPQDQRVVHRSTFPLGFNGFMNAYLLTADDRYLEPWRKMFEVVNSHSKMIDGRLQYPTKYGDDGWYAFAPQHYSPYAPELYYLSLDPRDRKWVGQDGWLDYLDGKNPAFAERALQADLARIRTRVQGLRADDTTPDTRLSDDPMKFNPASVESLIQLMLGGLHPGHRSSLLFSRLRYFDPVARRAGLPEDVAALVEKLTSDETIVTLVNVSPVAERQVIVQGGSYAEHQIQQVQRDGKMTTVNAPTFEVRLAPGCGAKLTLKTQRYANQPTLQMPWDR
jgi:hypothetical protein